MSRLRRLGRHGVTPSLQSVAIGLALALSVIAIILPQVQRSSVPEPIRETFSVGERVYELRAAPRPLTSDTSDAILAEAIGTVLDHIAVNYDFAVRTNRLSREWLPSIPLDFQAPDGFFYQVSVTRLEGEPLTWGEDGAVSLLPLALAEIFPEGREQVRGRLGTE